MIILSFMLGTFLALVTFVVIMITSSAKAKICKAEYLNQQNRVGNASVDTSITNPCVENSLTIQRQINELVKARYPTCSWRYEGNKMDLPFLDFIDIEILKDGTYLLTERISQKNNTVEHCEVY